MGERAGIARSGNARSAWWIGSDPATELQNLWGEIGRLFERSSQTSDPSRHWMPLVEEEDEGGTYIVRAELPGIPRERVTVEIDGRELHVHGTLDEATRGNALLRRSGTFSYGVRIPGDVDIDAVRADLSNGVLTVRLPKSKTSTRRSITVGASEESETLT